MTNSSDVIDPEDHEDAAEIRSWHASRDPYHTAFRMIRLLSRVEHQKLDLEKLYYFDFFLAFPFLLHLTHMKRPQRNRFSALRIRKPNEYFMALPSSAALFRDMASIQKTAASWMAAMGIFLKAEFLLGEAKFIQAAIPAELLSLASKRNEIEAAFIEFLLNDFGAASLPELREAIGFRRRILQWL